MTETFTLIHARNLLAINIAMILTLPTQAAFDVCDHMLEHLVREYYYVEGGQLMTLFTFDHFPGALELTAVGVLSKVERIEPAVALHLLSAMGHDDLLALANVALAYQEACHVN